VFTVGGFAPADAGSPNDAAEVFDAVVALKTAAFDVVAFDVAVGAAFARVGAVTRSIFGVAGASG
jgi:hypothetical protein